MKSRRKCRLGLLALLCSLILMVVPLHAEVTPAVTPLEPLDLSEASDAVRDAIEQARQAVLDTAQANDSVRAQVWGRYGEVLHAHGLSDPARSAYRNAHNLAPRVLDWLYLLGVLEIGEGRIESGLGYLDQVLQADSTDSPALIRRARVRLDQGQIEAAARDFEQALRLNPDAAAALAGMGQVALARENHGQAIEYLEQALAREPGATRLHQPLGLAHRAQGNTGRAQAYLESVGNGEVSLDDPLLERVRSRLRSPEIFLEIALNQVENGNLPAARQLLTNALSLAPYEPLIIEIYGSVSARMGDFNEARKAFAGLVELQPDNPKAHYLLAQAEELRGRLEAAERGYWRALELDSQHSAARESLAFVELSQRQFDAAGNAFAQLVQSSDDAESRTRLRYWQAMAHLGGGKCMDAASLLDELRRSTDEFDPPIMAALVRTRASCVDADEDQLSEAFSWAEMLYHNAPGIETAATLAMVYAAMDLFEDAVELQAQALFEALKAGSVDARPDLRENMERYRNEQKAELPFAPNHPVFGTNPQRQ